MQAATTVRILASDSNKSGDLFARLIESVFLSLGYENLRPNVHKSGREVDLEGVHRKEPRRVIAECKATEEPIGGADVNKFIGVLDAERRKHPDVETVGYFVSLNGFRETAIQQETDLGNSRVVLMNGQQALGELIQGKIICPSEAALHLAGRSLGLFGPDVKADGACELLAHELGFVWAVYFTKHHQRTHFSLVHADGELLAARLAEEIIAADKDLGGILHTLSFLRPPESCIDDAEQIATARVHYLDYISKECGDIELAGMPADQEAGSRRLRLENIFVPLHLVRSRQAEQEQGQAAGAPTSPVSQSPTVPAAVDPSAPDPRRTVGDVISEHSRLAILGLPGGGKSTLLKRLATAYAFPDRRQQIDDNLPARDWLPLFVRCRQIVHDLHPSILEILQGLQRRAEMPERLSAAFGALIAESLRSGTALLLIDGLDEISDAASRITFINQLRVFLSTYPAIGIVITSREAGFRIIGGTLGGACDHYRLADFDDHDIERLTLAWHKEVVGDRVEVRREAEKLAQAICKLDRVRRLAQNPLLLTTLLLVQRWVGQLPAKRTILYAKAIEVLLMTWNVEAHVPLDPEEVIPQLAFVAFEMMKLGTQNISSRRLRELLYQARKQMPEILSFARLSVNDLVEQVEMRSSILVLSGHTVENGSLYPMYEFRHLTFQEYLTARAIVDGFYPDRAETDDLVSVLQPYARRQEWKEVVPLTAVLAGREARGLISYLADQARFESQQNQITPEPPSIASVELLVRCIADEVQIAPNLLEASLEVVVRHWTTPDRLIIELASSRYGEVLLRICRRLYTGFGGDLLAIGGALGCAALVRFGWKPSFSLEETPIAKIDECLDSTDPLEKALGCLIAMYLGWFMRRGTPGPERDKIRAQIADQAQKWGQKIWPLLDSGTPFLQFPAIWAGNWLRRLGAWGSDIDVVSLNKLVDIWKSSEIPELQYVAAWSISDLPFKDRDAIRLDASAELVELVQSSVNSPEAPLWARAKKKAALILAYYMKAPWTDEQLTEKIRETDSFFSREAMLKSLGQQPGARTAKPRRIR